MSSQSNVRPEFPALEALGAEFSRLGASAEGARGVSRWPVGARIAIAAGLAALLAGFLALTPPGQSVADGFARLVGIGEIGGPPSIQSRPDNSQPAGDQVVIGNGQAPDGSRYEVVAYTTPSGGASDDTCAFIDYPNQGQPGGGICGGGPEGPVQIVSISRLPEGDHYLTGLAEPSTKTITVRIGGQEEGTQLQARVYQLEGEAQRQIGAEKPLAVFLAFLPDGFSGGPSDPPLEATAFDAQGNELGNDVRPTPSVGRPPAEVVQMCKNVLEAGVEHSVCEALVRSVDPQWSPN